MSKAVNWNNRYFLFIGDSYGDESSEWAAQLISYLNLGSRAENLCVSGAGFVSGGPGYLFIEQLQNYVGSHSADDLAKVTDIVVCGGLNDSTSNDLSTYTPVTTNMQSFNTYVLNNFPNAYVSLGYIGNGNDTDPNSLISGRIYDNRNACRYIYYNNAALLGWRVLYNVEYMLCARPLSIAADGVHPSTSGTVDLFRGIAQALVNGSADLITVEADIGFAALVGSMTGSITYKQHNDNTKVMIRNVGFTVGAGTQFTSGTGVAIGTLSNMRFNKPAYYNVIVGMFGCAIDGNPTTNVIYVKARLSFINDTVYLTILEADGTDNHTYNYSGSGNYSISDIDLDIDTMTLV